MRGQAHRGAGGSLPPIHVLLFDAYGGGGVARTVINLANHLAGQHDVELITLFRSRAEPRFSIDPRVQVTVLHDTRRTPSRRRALLAERPSLLRPKPWESRMNLMTDVLLRRKLRSLQSGILLTTRPSLHLAAARFAPRRLVLVGQDHSQFEARFRTRRQAKVLKYAVPRLDAFAVLTEEDAADYRRAIPGAGEVRFIPNALPWKVADTPAPLHSKVIVTAGRLDPGKGHARMIRAYAAVAERHPDWQLHIYGSGSERKALSLLIEKLGLTDQVALQGYTLDLKAALADASVYALTSHSEGFSMVLIEAMSVGLPPVAMDCPRGPRQIIKDGSNGLLVPDGDETAFACALLSLVEDEELRRRMGRQALEDAHAYEMEEVGAQWERLFADATLTRASKVTDRS